MKYIFAGAIYIFGTAIALLVAPFCGSTTDHIFTAAQWPVVILVRGIQATFAADGAPHARCHPTKGIIFYIPKDKE